MMLLGSYVQIGGKLRQSRSDRLRELVGTPPSIEQAKAWKSGLKELRTDLAALDAWAERFPAERGPTSKAQVS